MLHYVTKLGKKNYWRKSRSVRVFGTKTVTMIFFRVVVRMGKDMNTTVRIFIIFLQYLDFVLLLKVSYIYYVRAHLNFIIAGCSLSAAK